MPGGRPSDYTPEMAEKICELIATSSKGLRRILAGDEFPDVVTVMRWLRKHEDFRNQYAWAREVQADHLVDDGMQILDDCVEGSRDCMPGVMKARERATYRRWLAGRLRPKVYGDAVKLSGDAENPVTFKDLSERARQRDG